jgi:hypothetical protein
LFPVQARHGFAKPIAEVVLRHGIILAVMIARLVFHAEFLQRGAAKWSAVPVQRTLDLSTPKSV